MTELTNQATTIALLDGKLRVHDDTVWAGAWTAARARQMNLIRYVGGFLNDADPFERQRNIVFDLLNPAEITGIIAASSNKISMYVSPDELEAFFARIGPLPVMVCGTSITSTIPHVLIDIDDEIRQMMVHLIDVHGYRRIAHISGPADTEWSQERLVLYREVLAQHGIPFDPALVVEGDAALESGYKAMLALLAIPNLELDAVFSSNDSMAVGAIRALQEHGIVVPGDVAVVGIDNNEYAQIANPPLTTIGQSFHQQGMLAVESLKRILDGESVPHTILQSGDGLIIRRSCGCFSLAGGPVSPTTRPAGDDSRAALLADLTVALPTVAPDTLADLVDSLLADAADSLPAPFLTALDRVLSQAILNRETLQDWQSHLTTLRQFALNHARHNENIWQQARIIVAEAATRTEAMHRYEAEHRDQLLREVAQQLVLTVNLNDMGAILNRELPRLGINYFCVALCQSEPGQARVIAAANADGTTIDWQTAQTFRTDDLTPAELGRPPAPYSLTVEALYFQDEALGFVVFEAQPHLAHIYEALRLYLSSAIKGALLFQQVQSQTTQLETQVAERTRELELEIAERRRAESALRESQNMLELVLDSIPVKVFWKDRNSVFMGGNRACWVDAGLKSAAELVGMTDYDMVQGEMADVYRADDRRVMETGEVMLHQKESHISSTGEQRRLNTSKVPLRNDQGEVIGILATIEDVTALTQAQVALERERNLLRTIVEHAPMEIYAKDTNCRFTLANAITRRKLGAKDEAELLGKSDTELAIFAGQQALANKFVADERHILQTGEAILNQEIQPVDWPVEAGHRHWLLVNKVPLCAPDGEIIGLVGINHDITESKRAETALRESEERYRLLIEAAPMAVNVYVIHETGMRIAYANAMSVQLLGAKSREQLIGLDPDRLILPESKAYGAERMKALQQGESLGIGHFSVQRLDGRRVEVEVGSIAYVYDGQPAVLSILQDVTERRAAEAALRASEERYRQIVEAAPMATTIYLMDGPVSHLVYVNAAAVRLFGAQDAEQVVGMNPLDLITTQDRHVGRERMERLRHGDPPGMARYTLNRLDGREIEIEIGSIPYVYDGQPAVLSILQDITERTRAEIALRQSEEKFARAFRAVPDSVTISSSVDGRLIEINEGFTRVFGYKRDEAIGKTPADLSLFADRADRDRMVDILRREGRVIDLELRGRRKSGALCICTLSVEPITVGTEPCQVTIVHDITEQRAAEDALFASEERYRRIVEAAPMAINIMVHAGDGLKIAYSNREAVRLLGAENRDQLVGLDPVDFVVPESHHIAQERIDSLRAGQTPDNTTYTFRQLDGQSIEIEVGSIPYIYDGQPAVLSILQDVTERKRTESALRESEERYRLISELISDYAFAYRVNPDGKVEHEWTTVEAYQRVTGYQVLKPEPAATFFHPDDRERAVHDIRLSLNGQATGGEYRIITKNGDVRWIRLSRQIQWDEQQQRIVRLYGVAQDITESKHHEAERDRLFTELEQRTLEMERFIYTVSHDLRSPLITMKGFLGYLEEDIARANPQRVQSDLDYIRTAADQMENLLDDLLELSRIGRVENRMEAVPLRELVDKATRLVGGVIADRAVNVSVAPDLPVVQGDQDRLLEVFQNLIENAVRYMGDQAAPHIEVGASVEGEWVHCFVRDNGIGIDPAYHEKIFGLFDQLNPKLGGTGIGLALARRIVEAHGGTIHVESEGNGHGSTFVFTLRRAET